MRLLLDTHVFLWFATADDRLPIAWRDVIRTDANQVFLSVVSDWKIVIKSQIGKLPLPSRAEDLLPRARSIHQIISLPADERCIIHLARLPRLHADPFDRFLIAQTLAYDLTLVTVDRRIRAYAVPILEEDRSA